MPISFVSAVIQQPTPHAITTITVSTSDIDGKLYLHPEALLTGIKQLHRLRPVGNKDRSGPEYQQLSI